MSSDDYANHIYQKHRLAVALAIIKSKPANVKTEKYLEELKSKIDHKMDDDDITICSDDFIMDDDDDEMNDSVTILKDFDPEFVNNDGHWADGNAASEKRPTTPKFSNNEIPENLSQITHYNNSQNPTTIDIAVTLTAQYNQNFNQNLDIEQSIPKNVVNKDLTMLKGTKNNEFNDPITNTDHKTEITNNTTEVTSTEIINAEIVNSNAITANESMDVTYYDSQKTIPYTLHGFTENYTHFSPSQNVVIVPNKYLYAVHNKNVSTVQNKNTIEEKNITTGNINNYEKETQFVSKESNLNSIIDENLVNRENIECNKTMNMFSQRNDDNFDEVQHNINSKRDETIIDINNIINKDTEINTIQNLNKISQNVDEYFNEIQMIEDDNEHRNNNSTNNGINITKHNPEIINTEIIDEHFRYNQNIDYLSQDKEFSYNKNVFENANDIPKVIDHKIITNPENISEKEAHLPKESSEIDTSEQNKGRREEYKITEEDNESEEIISYKVLEEFNKVKSFLNRQNRRMSCDGYSTDSGYRSDSQRSTNRSALLHYNNQLSGNCLNQSGCCLFNYIMQCPLVSGTRDITSEIAQVLSQLIDRLHEEEKYPSFLEDLLETVDLLIRQIYEGESTEDTEFLKKDEHIQRILLLNKSIHIQKHSIEKITKILENFHSNVTETDSTYELSNIDEIENITYIFHILEILLKKYLINREIFSQNSTQNSQEDEKVFKKSSITDIWRKKWNPSQKVFEGSREKKCVLKNCSEILNKIVVDCVSSYSLVAYSALKCFNSMQN